MCWLWQEDRVARLADSGTIALENVTPAHPVLVDTGREIVAGIEPVQQVQSGVQTDASLVPVTVDSCTQVDPMTAAGQQMVVSVQEQAEADDAPPQPSTAVTEDVPAVSRPTAASISPSAGGPRRAPPPPPPPSLARRNQPSGQAVAAAAPAARGPAPPPPPPPPPPPGKGSAGSGGPPPPPPPPPLGLVRPGLAGAKQAPCGQEGVKSSSLQVMPKLHC